MEKGTPASRLPQWHSTLRRGIILTMHKLPIACYTDLAQAIQQACKEKVLYVQCKIVTDQYQLLHPSEGSLMLYHDQMHVVTQHLKHVFPCHTTTVHKLILSKIEGPPLSDEELRKHSPENNLSDIQIGNNGKLHDTNAR